ncbi:MAG: cytochrome c [Saprospirales bacterium]|nr:cytochrome c [Saprospirales bacterium]
MASMRHTLFVFITVSIILITLSCQQPGGNTTGSEYMPDMVYSTAYEANVYYSYSLNTWDSASVFTRKELMDPRGPVAGTVPRGYSGYSFAHTPQEQQAVMAMLTGQTPGSVSTPVNGHVPYYYADTEDERIRAIAEIIDNPFPITEAGLAKGQELYVIFCGVCHGEKGDGAGYLVRDPNPATGDAGGLYPAAPANFMLDDFINSSNGRYYHGIMYGRNMMGSYADKLSYEERWQVIHYIRSLQAKAKGMEYSEAANTLNPAYGVPGASLAPVPQEEATMEEMSMDAGGEHQTDGSHH